MSESIIHLMPGLEVLGGQGKHGQAGVSRQATVPRQRQGSGAVEVVDAQHCSPPLLGAVTAVGEPKYTGRVVHAESP